MTYLKDKAKLSNVVLGKQLLQTVVNGWVYILQVLQGRLMPHQLPAHTVCSRLHIKGVDCTLALITDHGMWLSSHSRPETFQTCMPVCVFQCTGQ